LSSLAAIAIGVVLAVTVGQAFPSANANTGTFPRQLSVSGVGWNFTASLNTTSVIPGQTILLEAVLTNISPSNQTIAPDIDPFVNPGIYAQNETQLWAWNPPQVNSPSNTLVSGQSYAADVAIPTSKLRSGQVYLIKVVPISTEFLSPVDFTLVFQFLVT